ncbi:MAG TPA: hypothetical protein VHM92_09270 [Allosphingosinicella sp.]|nr:hypothetical protein [Allosphingosinicella sp.]
MAKRKILARDAKGRFLPGGVSAAGGASPAPRKAKAAAGGWTAAKERIFFRELAIVCNVSSALRACGLARQSRSVYDRRRADTRFRARWDEAVDEGYAMLDLEMLERGRFGANRPPPATEIEARLREVPTALGLQLLKLYHARKVRGGGAAPARPGAGRLSRAEAAAIRREFDQRLSEFNRRMGGQG